MSETQEKLAASVAARFEGRVRRVPSSCGELTFKVDPAALIEVCRALRDEPDWRFEQLVDLTGVDYLTFGRAEWTTESATSSGFSRGRTGSMVAGASPGEGAHEERRFAVVYHLLSVTHNHRLRLRAFTAGGEPPMLDSVVDVWKSADWFEREAFDLFGILFLGHPDLRRILTDYGFIGHPLRKDFPVSGHVEMRYDAEKKRVIYQPVTIEPREIVPRVLREEHYADAKLKP